MTFCSEKHFIFLSIFQRATSKIPNVKELKNFLKYECNISRQISWFDFLYEKTDLVNFCVGNGADVLIFVSVRPRKDFSKVKLISVNCLFDITIK